MLCPIGCGWLWIICAADVCGRSMLRPYGFGFGMSLLIGDLEFVGAQHAVPDWVWMAVDYLCRGCLRAQHAAPLRDSLECLIFFYFVFYITSQHKKVDGGANGVNK